MINLENVRNKFKNHIATLTDYGNIKILDFKNPQFSEYRIRFLFEEDYYRLHISGDLGELTATNYYNMTYEKFSDFVNDSGYFEQKVDCHSRPLYIYDEKCAEEDLKEYFEEYDIYDAILSDKYDWQTEEEKIDEVIKDVLEDFSEDTGIGTQGYNCLAEYITDPRDAYNFGKRVGLKETGILELYLFAFKLAKEQLEAENKSE